MPRRRTERSAVYVISVAAELAGVHPQTLRTYERKGLLQPQRTTGNTRRYSASDIARLRRIQELTQSQGVNLAGAKMVLRLEEQLERMSQQLEEAAERIAGLEAATERQRRRASESAGEEMVPVRESRTLHELWIEYRQKEPGPGRRPIELPPPGTAG